MPSFKANNPKTDLDKSINSDFWKMFDLIKKYHEEVFENDLPNEMSNNFVGYGVLNQFNKNYHYHKITLTSGRKSHRYLSQIIAAWLEQKYDKDFEIHHIGSRDETGKYDDKEVIIIYGDSKDEVKSIHQSFHNWTVNSSRRKRGEIK